MCMHCEVSVRESEVKRERVCVCDIKRERGETEERDRERVCVCDIERERERREREERPSWVPSGLNARSWTEFVCPFRVRSNSPLS